MSQIRPDLVRTWAKYMTRHFTKEDTQEANKQIKIYLIALYSVTQSCPTLCNPIDYSPPGSSVHGVFQARIPEWVAISFSRESSRSRDRTYISWVSCIGRQILLPLCHLGIHLDCFGSFAFSYTFQNSLINFHKKLAGTLTGVVLNLQIILGRIDTINIESSSPGTRCSSPFTNVFLNFSRHSAFCFKPHCILALGGN